MNKEFLIVNNGTSHLHELGNLVKTYGSYDIGMPSDLTHMNKYKATILSGSNERYFKSHIKDYPGTIKAIRTAVTPILGICLGFELIAHAYGMQLQRMDAKFQGIQQIKPTAKNKTIFDQAAQYLVYEGHRWIGPNTARPKRLEVLAKSQHGIEVFRVKNTNIFGFQFHPEVEEYEGVKTNGRELFEGFLRASNLIDGVDSS